LRTTTTILSQVSRCPGRGSNQASAEYECRVLPPCAPARSVTQFTWLSCKLSISLVCKRECLNGRYFLISCLIVDFIAVKGFRCWMCACAPGARAGVCLYNTSPQLHVNRRRERGCDAGDAAHTNATQAVRILTRGSH
jgi:hypothetical protein